MKDLLPLDRTDGNADEANDPEVDEEGGGESSGVEVERAPVPRARGRPREIGRAHV